MKMNEAGMEWGRGVLFPQGHIFLSAAEGLTLEARRKGTVFSILGCHPHWQDQVLGPSPDQHDLYMPMVLNTHTLAWPSLALKLDPAATCHLCNLIAVIRQNWVISYVLRLFADASLLNRCAYINP